MKKDVIYIDVEDDITAIIDKTLAAKQPIAALVLPKRASVLMSSVNMKLLKKSAAQAKKRLVLITNDQTIRTIAGAAELYVAKNLQSKPEIPTVAKSLPAEITASESDALEPKSSLEAPVATPPSKQNRFGKMFGKKVPVETSTGAVAATGAAAAAGVAAVDDTVELDNTASVGELADAATGKKKKNPRLAIPSFEKFRLWFFLAIASFVVLLIAGVVFALRMPKASVVIKTKTKDELLSLEFVANTATKAVDAEQKKIPVTIKEAKKTLSEKAASTGQLDKGTKATGTVTLTNCSKEDKLDDTTRTVPAGSTVSIDGLAYVTAGDVVLEPSGYTGNTCKFDKSKDVGVTAKEAGEKYNVAAKDGYTVSGLATASGSGSAMTGGTSLVVKVVSEEDLAAIRTKITSAPADDQKSALDKQLQDESFIAIADTFSATQGEVVVSARAGDEVAEITATLGNTYTMAGVKKDDLESLIKAEGLKKLDKEKEEVYDSGIGNARLKVTKPGSPGEYLLAVSSKVVSGPKINQDQIKKDIAGKKKGQAESQIETWPGVQDAIVEYKPFWVSKAPSKPERITITVESTNGSE